MDDLEVSRKLIVDHIAVKLVAELKKELESLDKVVTHNAKESIQYYPHLTAIATELSYVLNIEYGREAGSFPPKEPIVRWLMNKFGMPREQAERESYPVRKHINDHGIEMTRFIKHTIERFTR